MNGNISSSHQSPRTDAIAVQVNATGSPALSSSAPNVLSLRRHVDILLPPSSTLRKIRGGWMIADPADHVPVEGNRLRIPGPLPTTCCITARNGSDPFPVVTSPGPSPRTTAPPDRTAACPATGRVRRSPENTDANCTASRRPPGPTAGQTPGGGRPRSTPAVDALPASPFPSEPGLDAAGAEARWIDRRCAELGCR